MWIADDPDIARQLFEVGADAVATNDPRAIVPIRDAVSPSVFRRKGFPDHLREPLDGLRAAVRDRAAKAAMTSTVPVDAAPGDAARRGGRGVRG